MTKQILSFFLSLWMIVGSGGAVQESQTIDIVVDGKSEYVIVIADGAETAVQNAANELQSYIEQISGAKLEIVSDTTPATAKELVVGKTNREAKGEFDRDELGTDGLVIKANEDKIFFIGGGNRGTLYAVYEFLESYLGCRFYTVDVEKIPETKTISVEIPEEDKQIPVIEYREAFWTEYLIGSNEGICVKRKLHRSRGDNISEEWGGSINYAGNAVGHTFLGLVSPDLYFEEHPEYFSLVNGTRQARQLCVSNPDIIPIATESVLEILRNNPNGELVSVSHMDWGDYCTCENCEAIYAEEGGAISGAHVRFVNAIAEEVEKEFPNAKIHMFAYSYARSAPITKVRDNVVVQICITECHRHGFYEDCGYTPVREAVSETTMYEDFANWSKVCENIYIWDYTTDFINFNLTWPNFEAVRLNARFFADNNVTGVYEQGPDAYQEQSGEFGELRAYLMSKVLWDPYMTKEEYCAHMDDFLEGVYGPGWEYIREYIDYAHEITEDKHLETFSESDDIYPVTIVEKNDRALPEDLTLDMIIDYKNTDWTPYLTWYTDVIPTPLIAKGDEMFAKAMELTETDKQREKLDKASIQVDYLRSYYLYHYYSKVAPDDLVDLIKAFLEENAGDMEKKEVNKIRNKAVAHVKRMCQDMYIEYNTGLHERLEQYGLRVREIYIHQYPSLIAYPSMWNIT